MLLSVMFNSIMVPAMVGSSVYMCVVSSCGRIDTENVATCKTRMQKSVEEKLQV